MGIERVEGVDFTPSSFAHFPSQHPFRLYFCAPGAEVMFVRKASRGRPRPGPDTAQRAVSGSTMKHAVRDVSNAAILLLHKTEPGQRPMATMYYDEDKLMKTCDSADNFNTNKTFYL